MRRNLVAIPFLMVALAVTAWGCTWVGVGVGVSSAPPPPRVVYHSHPHLVLVPGSRVYVVEEAYVPYDTFRYGSYWYVYADGWWYRGSSYSGPFAVIEVHRVPQAIISVPARHWKHHPHGGPPGQMKKRWRG